MFTLQVTALNGALLTQFLQAGKGWIENLQVFKERNVYLAHSAGVQAITLGKAWQQDRTAEWIGKPGERTLALSQFPHVTLFIHSWTPVCGVVLSTFRAGLPSNFEKKPGFVFM